MKVISVNVGERRTVQWRNSSVETGIFKYPVDGPITLGFTDVEGDAVVDRKYHGGIVKALYSYPSDHYPFWKEKYPDLDWDHGMFGENLTIEGLNETKLRIGSTYKVGDAEIQVSEPRQPCFKLGIRFNTQSILKPFMNSTFCGVYFRVITPGSVVVGDELKEIRIREENPTVAEVYSLIYKKETETNELTVAALNCAELSDPVKTAILKMQTGS